MARIDMPSHHSWSDRRQPADYPPDPDPLQRPGLAAMLAACPVTFVSAAEWRWEEGRRCELRTLPTSNIALYHSGSGVVTVAGVRHSIAAGSLVVTPRGWAQAVSHAPGMPFHASAVHCQAPVFGGPRDLFAALGCPIHLHVDAVSDAVLVEAMTELPRLYALRMAGWEARAAAQVTLLIHHLIATRGSLFTPIDDLERDREAIRLAPSLELIEARLDQPLRIAVLCAAIGLKDVSFRRLMHRVTGRSPLAYLQDRRIDHACRMLRQCDATIPEIARAVGMQDASAFSRLFRRRIGVSPGAWRASSLMP